MQLILSYFLDCEKRGDAPKPVYAIVCSNGHILGWSINRRHAVKESGKYGDIHGALRIMKISP